MKKTNLINKIIHPSILGFFLLSILLLPILKYHLLNSTLIDLGIFLNLLYTPQNIGHSHFWGYVDLYRMLSYFNDFIGYLLLFLQSTLILSSMLFVKKIDDGRLIGLFVFSLFYAVWYNSLFDFHFDHLSIPLLFAFYYVVKERKHNSAVSIVILVSLIKEPFALVASFMGLYMMVKSKEYLKGGLLFVYGVTYFYLITNYVIPFFTPDYFVVGTDLDNTFGSGGSLLDILLYPVTHFKEFIVGIVTTKKIIYLIVLFSAVGFIAVFFSPLELIPAIPSLGIAMLSNVENYYWYNTHYTAPLIAPFIVAFIYGLPKVIVFTKRHLSYLDSDKKVLVVVFIPIILSHIVFSPSPLSRFFWINASSSYHYSKYIPTERTSIIKNALLTYIPYDENMSVASQNSLNLGYLAYRKNYFAFPQGVFKNINTVYVDSDNFVNTMSHLIRQDKSIIKSKEVRADYVTIDTKRTLYLGDKVVNYDQFMEVIDKMKQSYDVVYDYDGFYIYKKNT